MATQSSILAGRIPRTEESGGVLSMGLQRVGHDWATELNWTENHCWRWLQPWNKKTLAPWKKSYDKPTKHIKKQRYHFANKGLYSQSYGFSNSHIWMWELDHKEGWVPKNWCFWIVMLENTPESPLDCKEIKPVNPKGNQPWIFIVRADAETKALIFWPPDVVSLDVTH